MRMRKRVFWIGISPILGFVGLVLLASLRNLPDTEALANPRTDLATRVFSSDGKIIGRYYAENRSDARFDELPQHLIDALVCTEDARFYEHSGVDFIGLARAVFFLGSRGGGSTVTQQLAKLLFTESYDQTSLLERALLQKPKEWIIAAQLERYYTKGEILALYLNRYDFLNQAVGIKSAANVYFDKDVKDLNVQESAMLVGMLKNSSLFNPLRREELVLDRRETVMSQMVRYGKLEEAVFDSLRALPLGLNYQPVSHDEGTAPYFREILRAELRDLLQEKNDDGTFKIAKADGTPYDLYRDGLQIFTTIDSRLQKAAEAAVHAHLANELQAAFEKDLKKRPESDYPFTEALTPQYGKAFWMKRLQAASDISNARVRCVRSAAARRFTSSPLRRTGCRLGPVMRTRGDAVTPGPGPRRRRLKRSSTPRCPCAFSPTRAPRTPSCRRWTASSTTKRCCMLV